MEDDEDLIDEHHLQVAKESMRAADPDRAEEQFKEFFGAGSSTWTGWDERFVTIIENNSRAGLLYGTMGNDWHFLFAPAAAEGFWVFADETMKGKGFLKPDTLALLTEIAVEKGLFTR